MMNYREEYEYSELNIYTSENVTILNKEWKKLYTPILFDIDLTINDKDTYLALLSKCYKIGYVNKNNQSIYKGVSQDTLSDITSIDSKNIHRSISRLEREGYILSRDGGVRNEYHLIEMVKENGRVESFLPIPIEYFTNLKHSKKLFIDTIKALLLSWGNDKVPSRASCLNRFGNLSKDEYFKLKKIHGGMEDVTIYKNLIHVLPQTPLSINYDENPFASQFDEINDLLNLDITIEEEVETIEPIQVETKTKTIEIPIQPIEEVEVLSYDEQLNALLDA